MHIGAQGLCYFYHENYEPSHMCKIEIHMLLFGEEDLDQHQIEEDLNKFLIALEEFLKSLIDETPKYSLNSKETSWMGGLLYWLTLE